MQPSPALSAPLEGRRASRRERTLRSGIVFYGADLLQMPCTIRDISQTGARIRVPPDQPVPDDLQLLEVRAGVVHHAHVVWRDAADAGLCFLSADSLESATAPHLRIIRRVWLAVRPQ